MKLAFLFIVVLIASCKPQEPKGSDQINWPKLSSFTPNPDDVVFHVKLLESSKSDAGWRSSVEVVRQLRSGFGYKNRIQPGTEIILLSNEKIEEQEFFCATSFQLGMGSGKDVFVFKSYLKD